MHVAGNVFLYVRWITISVVAASSGGVASTLPLQQER